MKPRIVSRPLPANPAVIVGKTYYVDANAANDAGAGTATSPKKYISSGMALLSSNGGDTLIVRPGVYANPLDAVGDGKAGKPGAWNIVRAEVDGTATLSAGLSLGLSDHYLQFEGLKWDGNNEKHVNGRYAKFLRCAFKDGPTSGNSVILGIGTNDATPGAQFILVEDSNVYGAGGRYNLLVYNADKVVLRRVVARHGDGWTDTKGDPQAAVSLYNSTDVLAQNLLIVDSGATGYFEAALYHPSNNRPSSNIRDIGAIVLNTAGTAISWDGPNPSSSNLLEDSAIWGATHAIVVNGSAHTGLINRVTVGQTTNGIEDYNGGHLFNVRNSVAWRVSNNNFSIPHSNNVCHAPACNGEQDLDPAATGLTWLPMIRTGGALNTAGAGSTRAGASLLKRLGVSGTLYGETGYDSVTSENLWPWPRESTIRQQMCTDIGTATGFCARPSLTQYVWEQLGNPMPATFEQQ